MRVIAIAGPKRSGKDTLADLVGDSLQRRGMTLERDAFAAPLRWAADAMGLPARATREDKDLPLAELGGRTGRDFMVMLGEGARGLLSDFFARGLAARLGDLGARDRGASVAVTDLRRSNEVDALARWAGEAPGREVAFVWVDRPGATADEVLEAEVRGRCAVIGNAGTVADLVRRADGIADWLAGGRGPIGWQGPGVGP